MKDIIKTGQGSIEITDAPLEAFDSTPAGWMAFAAQLEMIRVVELVYHLAAPEYPRVVKPRIWIGDSDEVNAYCDYDHCNIIVLRGLLERIDELIRRRATNGNLGNWPTASRGKPAWVRAGLWRQAIGFLTLHELYHMWHSHNAWKKRYSFDQQGKLILQTGGTSDSGLSDEYVEFCRDDLTAEALQRNLTQQAMEMDADASAVCMLINCMRYEYDALTGRGIVIDRLEYARDQIAMFGGAITVVFEVLYHMNEIGFERLGAIDLCAMTHPIPAIRRDYAEEVMGGMLFRYFKRDEVERIQGDYLVASDLMGEDEGPVLDWRSVYYLTAYTKKCQDHIVRIKQRMIDMYDTEKALALGNMLEKLEAADLPYPAGAVRFTDDGKSLRGWE